MKKRCAVSWMMVGVATVVMAKAAVKCLDTPQHRDSMVKRKLARITNDFQKAEKELFEKRVSQTYSISRATIED